MPSLVRLHCRARAGRRGPSPGVCRFAWGGGAGEAGRVIDLAYVAGRERSSERAPRDRNPLGEGGGDDRARGYLAEAGRYWGRTLGTDVTRSFLRAPLNCTSLSMNESTRWESA